MVSRSTDCMTVKIVSTNISTISRVVTASTKPGQIIDGRFNRADFGHLHIGGGGLFENGRADDGGFGGDQNDDYEAQFEASAAYLLSRNLAIGAEYRTKPNNLGIADEDDAWDVFVAWAPIKNVSLTVAYVDLGNIVIRDEQRGVYASLQVGF